MTHRCKNHQVQTSLFTRTVCRFAVGGDMSPPYRYGFGTIVLPYYIVLAINTCE